MAKLTKKTNNLIQNGQNTWTEISAKNQAQWGLTKT
jgi:hypothetical protein